MHIKIVLLKQHPIFFCFSRTISATHHGNNNNKFTGQIWLDDVDCSGYEIRLSDCVDRSWGSHNCGHSEDVVLECA